jgi:glycosyltransferase involved in cell wall biosynthesis
VTKSKSVGKKWGWNTLRVAEEWARRDKLDVVNIQFQTAAYDMHPAIHWLPELLKQIPVVVTLHDLRIPYLFPKAGPVRDWVVRKLAQDAKGVIATDRADAKRLSEVWNIQNVCWIPIGSNISTTPPVGFDRDEWRARMGLNTDDLLISYFGFLNESKGALILIRALERLVSSGIPAHLVMIGGRVGASDPTNAAYSQQIDAAILAANLDTKVHWTGYVDDAEVSACFYASDITALPYRDGVSLRRGTLMAAMAHGRAIVTTNPETAAPEIEGALITVPPDNPEPLAEAIMQLWNNAPLRVALEQAARNASEHFSWATIARRTTEYYEGVVTL